MDGRPARTGHRTGLLAGAIAGTRLSQWLSAGNRASGGLLSSAGRCPACSPRPSCGRSGGKPMSMSARALSSSDAAPDNAHLLTSLGCIVSPEVPENLFHRALLHREFGAKIFDITEDRRDGQHASLVLVSQQAILRFDIAIDRDLVPLLRMTDVIACSTNSKNFCRASAGTSLAGISSGHGERRKPLQRAGELLSVPALRKDGSQLSVEFTITPIRRHCEIVGLVAVMRDVTARFEEMKVLLQKIWALTSPAALS